MSTATSLYEHPDRDGSIEFDGGILDVANELETSVIRILIGSGSLRLLAERLVTLADQRNGGAE